MFWAFYGHLIWAIFHSGTLGTYDWKKSWKISSSKKVRFQGWLKLAKFWLVEFWGLPTLNSIIYGISPSILNILVLIVLQIFWSFWNSPNILNLHVFQGCYGQKSKKLKISKICQFEPTLKFNLFGKCGFSTFFPIRWPKCTRMKNRPYWMVKKTPKHQKKSKKWGI